jgi:SAM-dependent methyltransferase
MYAGYYGVARFETSAAASASLTALVQSCRDLRRTGRWLDVGYGEGGLLRIAGAHGWHCFGTELSPDALKEGEARGWTVCADAVQDARFELGSFDVVSMVEFLEHVEDPDDHLSAAARWLRPGGLLYLTTPNARSLNARVLGARWSVVSPPEHSVLWSGPGLRAALARAGLHVADLRAEGLNPVELLAALRAGKGSAAGSDTQAAIVVDRNQAGFALNDALSRSPLRRRLKRSANRVLSALGLGDTLKVRAVRGS